MDNDPNFIIAALERMWPLRVPYGTPGGFFSRVGRTLRERDGLVPRQLETGPRGYRQQGAVFTVADTISGEVG